MSWRGDKKLWVHTVKIAKQIAAGVILVVNVVAARHRTQRVIHGQDKMAVRTQESGLVALRRCKSRREVRDGPAAHTRKMRRTVSGILRKRKQTVPHLGTVTAKRPRSTPNIKRKYSGETAHRKSKCLKTG